MDDINKIDVKLQIIAQTSLYNQELVKKSGLVLEHLILNQTMPEEEVIFLLKDKLLPKLQILYEVFETNLEQEYSNKVIKGFYENCKDYLLYQRFVTLISNEIKLSEITSKDKVLFIGSGPFPISAILLHDLVGCHVECYEKNKESAQISRELLAHLNLSDEITVINKKGEELNQEYDTIIIALLAKPKDKILQRISKISPKARIICRTSDGIRQVFYESTPEHALEQFQIITKIEGVGDQTISSILLSYPNDELNQNEAKNS